MEDRINKMTFKIYRIRFQDWTLSGLEKDIKEMYYLSELPAKDVTKVVEEFNKFICNLRKQNYVSINDISYVGEQEMKDICRCPCSQI